MMQHMYMCSHATSQYNLQSSVLQMRNEREVQKREVVGERRAVWSGSRFNKAVKQLASPHRRKSITITSI